MGLAGRCQINDAATESAKDKERWMQGKGKIRKEWGSKRKKKLHRVVVKDFLILMGLMSSFIMMRYQWDFIFSFKTY